METHAATLLKHHGLNLTPVRLAVYDALKKYPHTDAAQVFRHVEKKIATTSIQAVYNNLNTLVEHGLVREIKPKGRPSLYEINLSDNHHHLVCRSCEQVMDTLCFGVAPCLVPADDHGFAIDEAEVIFWGTCPQCQSVNKKKEK